MHEEAFTPAPTLHNSKAEGHIKAVGSDEPTTPRDIGNVTEIDGGILEYVRECMNSRTITAEVRRQAALFQKDMDRMQGW